MAVVRFAVPFGQPTLPGARGLLDGLMGAGGAVTEAAVDALVRSVSTGSTEREIEAMSRELRGRLWDDPSLGALVHQYHGIEALAAQVSEPGKLRPAAAVALRSLALCQPEYAEAVASVLPGAEGLTGPALSTFITRRYADGSDVEAAVQAASGVAAVQTSIRANKSCLNQTKTAKHVLMRKGAPARSRDYTRMVSCEVCLTDLRGARWECSACSWHVCAECYGEE